MSTEEQYLPISARKDKFQIKSAALAPVIFTRKNKCRLSVQKDQSTFFQRLGAMGIKEEDFIRIELYNEEKIPFLA